MRYTTYRYNKQTCQYERVRINAGNVIWYCLSLVVMTACMLVGILVLHDFFVNTETEIQLRKENRALKQHHEILSSSLDQLQPTLTSLQNKDRILHSRFFGTQPILPERKSESMSKEKVLLADGTAFRKILASLKESSQQLIQTSSTSNIYFAKELTLTKDQLNVISSLPTLQPIQPWQDDKLISGFGLRVNPFHKGLYEHLGIDVAMPRGTPVIASASGVVKELKRSDMQAGYGNYIEIDHGQKIVTRYAHLQDIGIRYGQKVMKGDVIGTVGSSGGSIAPHLHYEILRDGENVDPILYMVEGLSSHQHNQLAFMSHQQNQSLD